MSGLDAAERCDDHPRAAGATRRVACAATVCVMRLVSYNPFRTLGLPGVTLLKPEYLFRHGPQVAQADWVLFPESWQLNVLRYAWKARVFPSPATYDLGYDKVEMTRGFQAVAPGHVPTTLILPPGEASVRRVLDELGLPVVVKEPRSSMGHGVCLVETAGALRDWSHRTDVLYAQEYLPIAADLRVVWIGERVVTAYWRRGGDGFRHNLALGGVADFEAIPDAALALVERVATALGIDHAGFDIAMLDGYPFLLELNLLFGNEALIQRGIRVEPLILDYLHRVDGRGRPDPEVPMPEAI